LSLSWLIWLGVDVGKLLDYLLAVSKIRQNQPVHQHQIRKDVKQPENRLPVSTWHKQCENRARKLPEGQPAPQNSQRAVPAAQD
jgi:hypothetical protein